MKKNLLLMMLCCPVILAAQNGVTVKGLNVNAGTVTFNVSWETPMPVTLWSDTVWVFVDYNKNGVMERLPLLPGATLTATSPGGKVIEEPDNNKGVWVAGNARSTGSFSATVKLLTEVKDVGGACVYGSNYPPVGEYSKSDASEIKFTGTPQYDVVLLHESGNLVATTTNSPLYVPAGYIVQSFTDKTGAPGLIGGIHQLQGSCTYTEPALVGTFASFDAGAATYVSLRDERDNKVYPVVKIGGRWIMARNLNYQTGLTFNSASNQANGKSFTAYSAGAGTFAIGSFWCPGGNGTTSSARANCDVWGALYTWETAMMVDGKWSNDSRNNTDWGSNPPASTNTTSANTNNGNRGTGSTDGHGICPPNWHVPTDGEWGDLLNAMDNSKVHNTGGTAWIGGNAGTNAKSKCNCSSASYCTTDSGEGAVTSWYGGSDSKPGSDKYGLRVLPSGLRGYDGSTFYYRGTVAYFWSSSAYDGTNAWYREFSYNNADVARYYSHRSYGFSVRCMKD